MLELNSKDMSNIFFFVTFCTNFCLFLNKTVACVRVVNTSVFIHTFKLLLSLLPFNLKIGSSSGFQTFTFTFFRVRKTVKIFLEPFTANLTLPQISGLKIDAHTQIKFISWIEAASQIQANSQRDMLHHTLRHP